MSLRDHLKASSREERAKLKTMSWKDRFWYIWEYYKIHLLGLVILGCVIYLIATIIYNQTFDDQLYYVVMNNENPSGSDFEEFDQAFKDYMGYGKKDRITADGSVYLDFSQASSDAFAYMTKVSALVSSRELDIIIADPDTFDHYAESDAFLNLEDALPDDLWEALKDDVHVAVDGSGNQIPCGIDISQSRFPQETGVTISPSCCFGIVSNSERTDTAISWLRFIFDQ